MEQSNILEQVNKEHTKPQERKIPVMTEKEQYYYRKYAIIRYIRKRITQNKNFLALFTGPTGSGKSWTSLSIAEMLNEDFNISRLVSKRTLFLNCLSKYLSMFFI